MANNILSNGRIQQQTTTSQRLKNDKGKKVSEIPAIESNNWLLHRHYTRQEYKTCKILIDQELSRSNGHNEYANYLKGLILRREGKIQDSLNCFQAAYNVNSTNVNNVKQIAKSLLIMGSHKRAIDAYLEAEKISNVPDWEIYLNLGKLGRQRQYYNELYERKCSMTGECYTKLNQLYEAKKHLKRSIELTRNELPYIALAKVCLLEDHVTEARNAYTAALRFNSIAREMVGSNVLVYDTATEYYVLPLALPTNYRRWIKKNAAANPESIEAATELGLLYLKIGDVQRAFQQFGTALAHSPNCTKAILPIAYVIQNHQEYDVALSKYKLAAQSIPESYTLWNNVGMCFYGKQKFVAAISCLKRAHYLNPMAYLPTYNLGMVFLTTGQPASAAIYLCAAVSAEPKNPMPYLLLGLALKRLDDLEGAEKVLQRAHALSPQDPLILINYAIVLEALGKRSMAAEFLTALNDITAVINVDAQITQTAKKLSTKLQQENTPVKEETRVLSTDEV